MPPVDAAQVFGTEHPTTVAPEAEGPVDATVEQAAIMAVQAIQQLVERTGDLSPATRAALEHASRLLLTYLNE